MSKGGGKDIPIGMRKPHKGSHSERNNQHKAAWFQATKPDGAPGGKFQAPFTPGAVLQKAKWEFNSNMNKWEVS